MKLILKYLKKYKKLLVLNVISVFGFALVELGIPTIIANMIDIGVKNQDRNYLYSMWGAILVISIVGVAGTILLGIAVQRFQRQLHVISVTIFLQRCRISHLANSINLGFHH